MSFDDRAGDRQPESRAIAGARGVRAAAVEGDEHLLTLGQGDSLAGVGDLDLNTGRLTQAPRWMRENGLEWLFRLAAEPKRLWRRYLVMGPIFAWNVSLELLGLKAFD